MSKLIITYSSLMVVALGFVACSSGERHIDNVAVYASPSDNPGEEITNLESKMADARERKVNVLSPTWYRSAEMSLQDAREMREKGGNFQDMFREINEGKLQLQRAEEFAKVGDKKLGDVLKARDEAWKANQAADQAGATNTNQIKEAYADADGEFMNLTKAIEENDLAYVDKNKQNVILQYAKLANRSLIKEELDGARRTIEFAKKEGAEKYAPKSLAYAQELLETSENQVLTQAGGKAQMQNKGKEALFYANRALEITRQAKLISDKSPEEVALAMETSVAAMERELGLGDLRDRTFDEQFAAVRTRAGEYHAAVGTRDDSGKLVTALQKSQAKVKRFEGQKAKMEEISKMFRKEEAEVLEQGNKLIVRLRGIKFPVGESRLGAENFPLLTKVNEVVSSFPGSSVVIEGHTDSVGSPELNARLSQERADAVKEYLVSNEALDKDKVVGVGKGFKEPIASNRSKDGRAQNRRIDVVIQGTSDNTSTDSSTAPLAE